MLRLYAVIVQAFAVTGVQPMIALRLPGIMRSVVLQPQQPYDTAAMVAEGRESAEMTADLVRSMVPVLAAAGADLADIDLETLVDDLYRVHGDARIIAVGPICGVWAQQP